MADFDWTGVTSTAWTTGSNWSVGGVPQANPPTAADNALLSAADATNCVIGGPATCLNFVCTGYAGTLSGTSTLAISGSMTLDATMTYSYTGIITFNATSGTHDIDTGGVTINNSLVFDGVGGSWQLVDDVMNSTNRDITLTNGSLDFNDFDYAGGRAFLFSNGNTRSLDLGDGTLTSISVSGTPWNLSNTSGLTFSAGNSTIVIAGASTGVLRTFAGGGLTYNNFEWAGAGTGDLLVSGSNTFNTFTISGIPGEVQWTAGTTNTATNWVISGTVGNLNTFTSGTPTSTYTLAKAGGGFVEADFLSVTDAIATPANNSWYIGTGSAVANTTGMTLTAPPAIREWAVAADTWNGTAGVKWKVPGGVAGAPVPTSADDVIIPTATDATASGSVDCKDCDVAGILDMPGGATLTATGDLTVSSGGTWEGAGTLNIDGNTEFDDAATITFSGIFNWLGGGSKTFDPGDNFINFSLNPEGVGGTLTLLDDIISSVTTKAIHASFGTFDANDFDLTMGGFQSTGTNVRTVQMGNGTWHSTGPTIRGWQSIDPTNLTLNAEGSTLILDGSGTGFVKWLAGDGLTFNDVIFAPIADTDIFNVWGSVTFHVLRIMAGFTATVLFETGKTQTVGSLNASGDASNLLVLASHTVGVNVPGDKWSIAKTGGGILSIDYVNISDCEPAPGTILYVGTHSVDGGGNDLTRVLFESAPSAGSGSLLLVGDE